MQKCIPAIIEQHVMEAAFVWFLRGHAVTLPNHTLVTLSQIDNRLEAHLDGLRVAGEPGWEIIEAELIEASEPEGVFAAAVLAFEGGDEAKVKEVLAAGTASPETARALVSALEWLEPATALRHIRPLLVAADPVFKRIGIGAAAVHRLKLRGEVLQAAFASDDPLLKARRSKAVGEVGLVDLQHAARANLKAKDPNCRFWAAWSTALLSGRMDAVAYLQNVAEAGGPSSERAAQIAMRQLPPREARAWLIRLVKELRQKRIAVVAAGAFADPEAIPFLLEQMKVPELARVAGESFSMITGVRLDNDKLEGQKPGGFEAGPTDSPEDENVEVTRTRTFLGPTRIWSGNGGPTTRGTSRRGPATCSASQSRRRRLGRPSRRAISASGRRRRWSWRSSTQDVPCSRSVPRGSASSASSNDRPPPNKGAHAQHGDDGGCGPTPKVPTAFVAATAGQRHAGGPNQSAGGQLTKRRPVQCLPGP